MNYCKTMEMYQQQIENLRIEKEELEEVVTALELDYDELAEENDELKLLLYRLHQVIGDISEHFEEYSHLCRTLFGVCTTAAPHLDAHKRRTVKGLVKKTGEQGQELNAGAFCMLAGLLIVPVVSLFTKKPDKALVDSAFASYDKEVVVHQRSAISD